MNQQLNIQFPKYRFDMQNAKELMFIAETLAENERLKKKVEQQAKTISVYKGHFTKQRKRLP